MKFATRTQHLDYLLTSLGMLLDPTRRLIFSDGNIAREWPFAYAQYRKDFVVWRDEVRKYCHAGGFYFDAEYQRTETLLHRFCHNVFEGLPRPNKEEARTGFNILLNELLAVLRSIPCEIDADLIPAASPFQAYMELRAICSTATARLELFDPYLGPEVYHRYLATVDPAVAVIVVTSDKTLADKRKAVGIVAVSQLYAAERPTTYRLLEASFHDRHLRCDDTIYHLGGSIKDAAKSTPFTIAPVSGSVGSHLDTLNAGAVEWFGPTQTTHKV